MTEGKSRAGRRGPEASRASDVLAREELVVHYQPVVRLSDRQVVGFEALARWKKPSGPVLEAEEFVPALIEAGRGVRLAERVIDEAAAELAVWLSGRPGESRFVAVNVAAADLDHDGLPDMIGRLIEKHGLPTGALMVELGEDRINVSEAEAASAVAAMRAAGARLAVDDFGAGHADAARLSRLPFDVVKTDRSLAAGYATSDDARARLEEVLGIARKAGVTVVAEGIEDERTAHALKALGCDLGQGYLFGGPRPIGRQLEASVSGSAAGES